MTAYNIIEKSDPDTHLGEKEFYDLIKDFQREFFLEIDFKERLSYTREPIAYINGVIREVQERDLKIQYRPEMKHHDTAKNYVGFVNSEITQAWRDDKRLKSLYNSTTRYCFLNKKDFFSIAVHVAEFRAMTKLSRKLKLIRRKFESVSLITNTTTRIVKKKRVTTPRKILTRLLKETDNKCSFCGYDDPGHLEVHHIDEDRTHKDPERLIMVCSNCHTKINHKEISRQDVEAKKKELSSQARLTPASKSRINIKTNIANISTGTNTTIVVKNVTQKYPPGCIGADPEKNTYIDYLVKRFNTYLKFDKGNTLNHAVFSKQLKNMFKLGNSKTIFNLSLNRFDELAGYIQSRIDGTKLAKVKGKNHKNYSSFDEYKNRVVI